MRDSTCSSSPLNSIADHPPSTAGRKAITLTEESLAAFNTDHAVVIFHAQGLALVFCEKTNERLTFTKFRRRHGTLGALWLASPRRRTYLDYETWRLHNLQRVTGTCAEVPGA